MPAFSSTLHTITKSVAQEKGLQHLLVAVFKFSLMTKIYTGNQVLAL